MYGQVTNVMPIIIDNECLKAIGGCLCIIAFVFYVFYRIFRVIKTPRKTCLWASNPDARVVGSAKDASSYFDFQR